MDEFIGTEAVITLPKHVVDADGALPHFTLAVRRYLHEHPDRWTRSGGDASINWPAC